MTKRRITCLCLVLLLLMPMLLSGCGKKVEKALADYTGHSGNRIGVQTVENDKYTLMWSDSSQRFALQIKGQSEWFLSAPTNLSATDEGSSPVIISYIKPEEQTTSTLQGGADCLAKDTAEAQTYSSEKLDNGFRAVYTFPEAEIAVTVEYLLGDNGLEIRIPVNGLQENANRILEIKLAPFMAAVSNDNGSYMMVPSGSGALMYAERSSKPEKYYESVYGEDASEPVNMQKRLQSQVYLPVFGSMNNTEGAKTGMVGIVEGGADCAMIYAQSGGTEQYSTVYASFHIRSKEKVVYNSSAQSKQTGTRYSDEVTAAEYLSVRYIPLSANKGDDVTYNGMAKCYRDYLISRGYLQNRPQSTPALSVNMLGATQITESLFGIPYQTDVAVTTLEQTQAIATELKALLGDKGMLMTLEGYGQGGLANAEVGGGFKLSSKVGNQKALNALVDYAAANGIALSMDYELAQFQESGSGISVGRDSVMGLSSLKAQIQTYNMNTALAVEKGLTWYLVARNRLSTVMDKAIAAVNKSNVGGLSVGSLNRIVYSDFRTEGYAASYGFSNDVESMLKSAKENGLLVVADDANAYVALNADYVTEAPMHSTGFSMFDQDIPFYSLVFQGYVPLSSASINMAVNTTDAYLQAVATGMTLQFTLCDTLHESIQFDEDTAFVSSRYADWKDQIAAMVNESADLYSKVGNQSITGYVRDGDVSITNFENGLIVYVNYADEAVNYNGVELEANSFIYR